MKAFSILLLALLALSCQSKEEDKSKEGPNTVNVENVEGSMPDTTSGTTLNEPTDTTRRDSL